MSSVVPNLTAEIQDEFLKELKPRILQEDLFSDFKHLTTKKMHEEDFKLPTISTAKNHQKDIPIGSDAGLKGPTTVRCRVPMIAYMVQMSNLF